MYIRPKEASKDCFMMYKFFFFKNPVVNIGDSSMELMHVLVCYRLFKCCFHVLFQILVEEL